MTWIDKANREIAKLCLASYTKANKRTNGQYYKIHRPYVVPQLAVDLVNAIGRNDEQTAKSIMLWELTR